MFKKIKFLAIIFVLFNYTQLVMAKNNFYADAKKNMRQKNTTYLNFYFKEI